MKFDVVILSDLINDVWDVQLLLENLKSVLHPQSRIILNLYSRLWEIPLSLAKYFGLSRPVLKQNWLTVEDMEGLFQLTDYEIIRSTKEVLFPTRFPPLNWILNRFIVRFWPFNHGAISNFIVARPLFKGNLEPEVYSVSVVVPARNEAGNIKKVFERIPDMGNTTEIVLVEGHSTDNTYQVIKETIPQYPGRKCQLLQQEGIGKADAVQLGFDHANGDVLMILDADLTVPPEDLPRFFSALISGKGELINGVRLIYPIEKEAMQYLNLVGNKVFSILFTWLIGQAIKDTLCGTKVLWKRDYSLIKKNRQYFGDFDPFGDFDLLFGAAKLNKKILDLPIRYKQRSYGSTNIHRWRHGLLLTRMVLFAAARLKFV
jgi:hypothetical protein